MKINKAGVVAVVPSQCHLWNKDPLVWEDMQGFAEVERYIDESHLIRKLVKCADCGQLYYYEFYEEIDWEEGEDPQYRLFLPITGKAVVERLNELSSMEILQYKPRLQFDWVKAKTVAWIR